MRSTAENFHRRVLEALVHLRGHGAEPQDRQLAVDALEKWIGHDTLTKLIAHIADVADYDRPCQRLYKGSPLSIRGLGALGAHLG